MNEKTIESLRDTITPKSDQLNADDLLAGPIIVKIMAVKRGSNADQPIDIIIDGGRQPYKPCKSMRRVMIAAWGDDGREWVGRSMKLYCDPNVKFGGVKVGGIRISHMSGIDTRLSVMLTTTRSKRSEYIVEPLQTPTPMPAKVKQAVSAIQKPKNTAANDTITGDPMEGDLTGIGGDYPITDSVKKKILDGFAAIGFDQTSLEIEYGKPMSEWMESDIPELREVLKAKKIEQAQQAQQAQAEQYDNQGEI
jgi:hypothetical protein